MAVEQSQSGSAVLTSAYVEVKSQDFATRHRRRVGWFAVWSVLLTLLLCGVFLLADGNILVPIGVIVVCGAIALVAQYPSTMMPITLAGACLFEQTAMVFKDSLTDRVPLFWDANTVVQVYAHQNFHGLPFNFFEVLFVVALASWLIRGIYTETLRVTWGSLVLPILAYMACVVCGVFYGIATGGDYRIALFEARPQFYLFFAYFIAMNSGRSAQRQLSAMLWIAALTIGFKGVLLTIRFFITLGGHTDPETGVGSHEESFFFNAFCLLLAVLWLARLEPKLQRVMFALLPFVVIANLANERRAATAALLVALPALMALASIAFADRRRLILGVTLTIALVSFLYFPAYWNKDGMLAQPARALKSEFSPDARDASSDVYRQAEDTNLMFTMKRSPIIGYGYGKPIILFTPMVDLSNIDPLIMYRTHDQILWVWMRLGTIGFFFFWLMISGILMRSANALRPEASWGLLPKCARQQSAAAIYAALLTIMLLIFGLYDMQLSSPRDMLFVGLWLGMFCLYLAEHPARAALPRYPLYRRRPTLTPAPQLMEGSPR